MTEKQRLSLKEASDLLGIGESAVRARFKAGKLEGERDNQGKIWVFVEPEMHPALKPAKELQTQGEIAAVRELMGALKTQLQGITAERDALRSSATENTRLRAEIAGAEAMIAAKEEIIKDLRELVEDTRKERDEWRKQAQTIALLDQQAPNPEQPVMPENRAAERVGWVARLFGSRKL